MFGYGYGKEQKKDSILQVPSVGQENKETERRILSKPVIIKWILFLIVSIYILITYYHASILSGIGGFLIVEHEPMESEIAVCLAGGNIERGLAAADIYKKGLASMILISREEPPDGYELLKGSGFSYPESIDLLRVLLQEAGVPEQAILERDTIVNSTVSEAVAIKKITEEENIKSMIIITSPYHTRRAWLTFKRVFKDSDMRILMLPSKYSGFKAEDWWKRRRYIKDVIIEYQKLIFYIAKYLI